LTNPAASLNLDIAARDQTFATDLYVLEIFSFGSELGVVPTAASQTKILSGLTFELWETSGARARLERTENTNMDWNHQRKAVYAGATPLLMEAQLRALTMTFAPPHDAFRTLMRETLDNLRYYFNTRNDVIFVHKFRHGCNGGRDIEPAFARPTVF